VPILWQPLFSAELPPYRLSKEERIEERQLLGELLERSGDFDTWGDEPDFDKIYVGELRRFRRRLQTELGLEESLELYNYLWFLQPMAEKERIIRQLKRIRFRSIPGGKTDTDRDS
jgi:hypothetical protein